MSDKLENLDDKTVEESDRPTPERTGIAAREVKAECDLPSGRTLRRHRSPGILTFRMVQNIQKHGIETAYIKYAAQTMTIDYAPIQDIDFEEGGAVDADDAFFIVQAIDSIANQSPSPKPRSPFTTSPD